MTTSNLGQIDVRGADGSVFLFTFSDNPILGQTLTDALGRGRTLWRKPELLTRFIVRELLADGMGLDKFGFTPVGHVAVTGYIVDSTSEMVTRTDETVVTFDEFVNSIPH